MPMRLGPATGMRFTLAFIDEAACIGCTLCIRACPTDAIVGAARQMHTILSDRCIGCELCLPPCPVDCIAMQPSRREWTLADAARARVHDEARRARLSRTTSKRETASPAATSTREQRKLAVAAALARARARR